MIKTDFDLAIIGGGLAGLSTAIQMNKLGYEVILFEKETFPFHKVCGEYIAMESWDFLQGLGVPLENMQLPKITRLHISDCRGKLLAHKLNPGGFGISRYSLDNELHQLAKQSGVVVYDNTKVLAIDFYQGKSVIKTNSATFNAKVACGSWGKRANIDIKLRREFIHQPPKKNQHFIAVKYHVKTDFPDDLIELHNFENGYCGISTVENNMQCLCYLTTAYNLQQCNNDIKKLEKTYLAKNPHLNQYFQFSKFIFNEPLVISQISFASKEAINDHIFMVGDAAGMIAPLCGNGMSMALHGSKLVVPILDNLLKGNLNRLDAERQYASIWKAQFNSRLRTGRWFQQLFGRPLVTNTALRALNSFPSLTSSLIGLTHGKPF
ncbi:NAD(P)/FAD-dependent oxidoreductase [Solitalea lacus]|uniref:NAD(P)/FAD-dependent oxidoreductase n=1 Tax=Solitalea lacus TaxID=2911172 RepID=UPI001EDB7894|nr:NAD(P)/FAD-dependent oxidoreductase [Solitalea lacus]UKJ07309.1 NAD(P)/FAD-dependent oxidoreductase [Solitalea lacus]